MKDVDLSLNIGQTLPIENLPLIWFQNVNPQDHTLLNGSNFPKERLGYLQMKRFFNW